MSWEPTDTMSLKKEFVHFARREGSNISELCVRYGISRKTGYKWLRRYELEGEEGLAARSRRPQCSPVETPEAVAARIGQVRREHPAWGARKLRAWLLRRGHTEVPSVSTVHAVLRRSGLVSTEASEAARPWRRFERAAPNDLWQMDFKGHFGIGTRGARCHPLTMLDDHSRYNLLLKACADETAATVQKHLAGCFRQYGLPLEILCDNGPPWGCPAGQQYWSGLAVWLLRVGVQVWHGRPHHPQTQGKEERFHRTLKAELLGSETGAGRAWGNHAVAQRAFDPWREIYNHERAHEALGMKVPADVYEPSARRFTGELPPVAGYYLEEDEQRRVLQKGQIAYGGRRWRIGEGFAGHPVALRPAGDDVVSVWFCRMQLGAIDLRSPKPARTGTWEELTPAREHQPL